MLTLSLEDHVWNEFYAGDGQWYPYDTGWSDTPMRVGDWSVSGDGDSGGGKENAVMIGWRGDGQIVNLLGRYPAKTVDGKIDYEYTRSLEITVKVRDADSHPVDGAVVTLITEYFYSPAVARVAIFGVTDRDGTTRLPVGDKRNFYVNVSSPLGHYPQPLSEVGDAISPKTFKPLVLKAEAVAGAAIEKELVLAGDDALGTPYGKVAHPSATATTWPTPAPDEVFHRLALELQLPVEHRPALSSLSGRTFVEPVEPGQADLYVTDAANYQRFVSGEPFAAAVVKEGIDAATLSVDLPDSAQEWYVVISNKRRAAFVELAKARLELKEVAPVSQPPPTPPPPEEAGGCSCGVAARAPDTPEARLGLLALLALLAASRRRARRCSREGAHQRLS